MRFILFNVVVAAGLIFLMTRSDGPVAPGGPGVFSEAILKATEVGDRVARRLARVGPTEPPAAAPPKTGAQAETAPPPLPPAIQVVPRETHAVPGDPAVAAPANGLDAQVRQRRAEVLGEATGQPRVTVEEGGEMMTPAERRRELDALVEQMELLYIDQIGG